MAESPGLCGQAHAGPAADAADGDRGDLPEAEHRLDSALTHWFWSRVGTLKRRMRRITIVALARKLVVLRRMWMAGAQFRWPEKAPAAKA